MADVTGEGGDRGDRGDNRMGPPHFGTERETLRAFLDYHRATLAMKCAGLSDEELRSRSMPPSALSLLGLVRHMAEVERAWFRRAFEDHDAPMVWSKEIDFQAAYDASASTRTEAFGAWEAEVETSRRIEREAESLDLAGYQPRWGEEVSLRMVMVHVLLEYGRHNGHADFLREGGRDGGGVSTRPQKCCLAVLIRRAIPSRVRTRRSSNSGLLSALWTAVTSARTVSAARLRASSSVSICTRNKASCAPERRSYARTRTVSGSSGGGCSRSQNHRWTRQRR